jgi:hypothetical protein
MYMRTYRQMQKDVFVIFAFIYRGGMSACFTPTFIIGAIFALTCPHHSSHVRGCAIPI